MRARSSGVPATGGRFNGRVTRVTTGVSAAFDARWLRAGALGGLATLTRPNGILIGIPLLLMAFTGRPGVKTLAGRLAALAPVPLALAAYSAYVYTLSGNLLGWLDAQRHWGYSLSRLPHRHLLSGLSAIEQDERQLTREKLRKGQRRTPVARDW